MREARTERNQTIKSMQIKSPLCITPSLRPGFNLGGAFVSIGYSKREGSEGRTRFRWEIVLPDGSEHSDDDMQSGCQGGTLQEGLESLCSFLLAAAESFDYHQRNGTEPNEDSNASLFSRPVAEWASHNDDELSMLQLALSEEELIVE